MRALRATSAELQRFPIDRHRLTPYAGPQCFPHLEDPARRFANDCKPGATLVPGTDVARKQLTECWLQCDRCRKWRVVERASLAALKPEEYGKGRSGCVEVDWGRCLGEARARYDAFLQRRSGKGSALEEDIAGVPADTVECEPAGAGKDGDDDLLIAGSLSDCSAGVGTSECGSDDEGRDLSRYQ